MLILLDQGTPVGIRNFLQGHDVRTAHQQGRSTLSNGELLRAAEESGFNVLITTDKNLVYQQNLSSRKDCARGSRKSRWNLIRAALPQIARAVNAAKAGSYSLVEISNL